ncbi:MAG: hypothetical protein Fur0042_17190 [Cyanophyceae cyanobacterium]
MNLDEQIQILINEAPQDGQTPALIQSVAPVLSHFGQQLGRDRFYVLQTLNGDWVRTTLSSRTEHGIEKTVIYAFATLEDAGNSPLPVKDPQVLAAPMPVTHILFQLMALKTVDSLVFFTRAGNLNQGTEISRDVFEETMRQYFQQLQSWQDGEDPTLTIA